MKYGMSRLDFPPAELAKARALLAIANVTRESGPLEYLLVETSVGISYRIYEDGLIILEKDFRSLKEDFADIKDYYDNKLSKALSLIFSKGAPVPKELASIQTILPYIIIGQDASREDVERLFADHQEEIYAEVASEHAQVYRGTGIIFINNLRDETLARHIIESQIFFREFKSQLARYLAIHRLVWEKIERIKEREKIKGNEIDGLRNELSDYQKTIHLIGARIDQMDAYLKTRQKLTDLKTMDEYLQPLFQFKFETLADTHAYIKHL
ncbi:hypothetical protein HYR65_03195 [Candidatus Azambacteria bacterium]|nr:hypothetical protein [Candidatus Azambacteria bacterium]